MHPMLFDAGTQLTEDRRLRLLVEFPRRPRRLRAALTLVRGERDRVPAGPRRVDRDGPNAA